MTGRLTLDNRNGDSANPLWMRINFTSESTTVPSSTAYYHWASRLTDTNNTTVAEQTFINATDGSHWARLSMTRKMSSTTSKSNYLQLGVNSSGNAIASFSDPNAWWDGLSVTSILLNAWSTLLAFRTDSSYFTVFIPTERLTTNATKWNVTNAAWTCHGIYSSGSPIAVTTDTLSHLQSNSGRIGTIGFAIVYSKPSTLPSNIEGIAVPRNAITISKAS